ncbi:hypothetical protein SDC9_195131 [bioreactor metagenome]|uniref:Uncharacterized protein n=1 Tax=bioreactor metagenome TaxID=1076179 RepID=A0A645I8E0_9ZZZZ
MKEQQCMNLRHRAIHAPGVAHISPVVHKAFSDRTQLHETKCGLA